VTEGVKSPLTMLMAITACPPFNTNKYRAWQSPVLLFIGYFHI
jgi:hypothetical protein